MKTVSCEGECGRTFIRRHGSQRFCSKTCRNIASHHDQIDLLIGYLHGHPEGVTMHDIMRELSVTANRGYPLIHLARATQIIAADQGLPNEVIIHDGHHRFRFAANADEATAWFDGLGDRALRNLQSAIDYAHQSRLRFAPGTTKRVAWATIEHSLKAAEGAWHLAANTK